MLQPDAQAPALKAPVLRLPVWLLQGLPVSSLQLSWLPAFSLLFS